MGMANLQMSASSLLGRYMVNIRPRDPQSALIFWLAANACATCFNDIKVISENRVSEIQGPGRGDGVAEALLGARSFVSGWKMLCHREDGSQRSWWARRSRTCRLPGRRTRRGLRDSLRPLRSGVCFGEASLCRR